MRLLADVNVVQDAVALLREAGHDVLWASEIAHRETALNLLRQASREQRTLISYDTDYGELVHRDGEPAPFRVIQFRIHDDVPAESQANFIHHTVLIWEHWPAGVWTVQIRHRGS